MQRCIYDGGDCCGGCANTDQCIDCLCHDGGATRADTSCKCFILVAELFYPQNLESDRIGETENFSIIS